MRTSSDQLARWQKARLIRSPHVRHFGQGLGTEAFYPPITYYQAFTVAWTLRVRRDFEFVRWVLWCYGFPGLTDDVRKDLVRLLEQDEQLLKKGLNAFLRGDPSNPIEAVALAHRAPAGWEKTRRTFGRRKSDTVARMFYEAFTGQLAETANQYEHSDLLLARRAAAAHSGLDASSAVEHEQIREGLVLFARELSVPRIIDALKAAEPPLLLRVLVEASGMWREEVESLPREWAAMPPVHYYLMWLSFRWVSPSLAKESALWVQDPDWPKPELPALIRIAQKEKLAFISGNKTASTDSSEPNPISKRRKRK